MTLLHNIEYMHICAALSESRGSGEIYFAAIAPDMELTVITLDEAPDILPCFDEDPQRADRYKTL